MSADALLQILTDADGAVPIDALIKRAGYSGKAAKEGKRELKKLIADGKVERDRGRSVRLSRAGVMVEGSVHFDERGVAYVLPAGKTAEPIMVRPEDTQRASEGDRVRAEIVVSRRQGRHQAALLEVYPQQARIVGLLKQVAQARYVVLNRPHPLIDAGGRVHRVRELPLRPSDAPAGVLAEVRLVGQPGSPEVEVVKVIGPPGEREAEFDKLIIEFNLDRPFPPEVVREAEAFGDAPTEADLEGRRDLRELGLVTIDGATARDFDDAVCVEDAGEGRSRLYVAIADVSHYVRSGSPLDREAQRRATSTYLTSQAIPMLPEALSNGLCSLNPHVDRLCMVAEVVVGSSGRILESSFYRAVMNSKARLTYEQVAEALEGRPDEQCTPLLGPLLRLNRVAGRLLERRLRRGAVDLDLPEAEICFDGEGQPVDAIQRPRNDAHRLIENLMLTANEAVARFFVREEIASIFRVHEPPNPLKLEALQQLAEQLGLQLRLPPEPAPGDVAQLLERLDTLEGGRALHTLVLRAMAQAKYEPVCRGHFGLASEAYLHFTSPIRRYPDLIVHRTLKGVLDERAPRYDAAELERIAVHASERERQAALAERASMDLDRALIARAHLGEEVEGRITGVQSFGLFCATESPFLDGLLPVQALEEDYYEPDAFGIALIGNHHGRRYQLGDALKLVIAGVNIERRQLEFSLAGAEPASPRKRRRPALPTRAEIMAGTAKPRRSFTPKKPKKPKRPR